MISTKSGVLGFLMIVIVAVSALGCASSDTAKTMGPYDMPVVAGKWVGNITTPGGTTTPGTVDISPSGDYVVQAAAFAATGKAQIKDGDIVFTPNYSSGSLGAGASRRTSTASVSQRPDGTLVMTGFGHSDGGPWNFMATKQK